MRKRENPPELLSANPELNSRRWVWNELINYLSLSISLQFYFHFLVRCLDHTVWQLVINFLSSGNLQ